MPYRKEFEIPKKRHNRKNLSSKIALCLLGVVLGLSIIFLMKTCSEDAAYYNYHSTAPFVIDETDEWAMHELELPTKGDVMNWHMSGYWGFHYYNENNEEIEKGWYELPGGSEVWDKLYGIDHDNPAFIRR